MQMDSLKYFVEIQRTGSINRAAKSLFMTQQGLNKAVSSLEGELGFKLIVRGRSGTSLTPEGAAFARFAEKTIANYDEMVNEVLENTRESVVCAEEKLDIVTTPYLMHVNFSDWMPTAVIRSFREQSFNKIMDLVGSAQGKDLFIVDLFPETLKRMREDARLCFVPIFSTRIGVVHRKSFPLGQGGVVSCEEVSRLPVAYTCDSTNKGLATYLFEDSPLENACMQSTNASMLLKWALKEGAVVLFDSYAYYLLIRHAHDSAFDELTFTPFSDGRAWDNIGFLYLDDAAENKVRDRVVSSTRLLFVRENAIYLKQHSLR